MLASAYPLVIALLGSSFWQLHSSFAQDISIVNPTPGANVQPGQKLNIALSIQDTTSSVTYLAFSTGFNAHPENDGSSLGRPYVGTVFLSPESHDVAFDSAKGTYSFDITVPSAADFLDGFSTPYNLTVSDYYLLGATFTPILKLTSVQVNVQDRNSTGGNPLKGGNSTNSDNTSKRSDHSTAPKNSTKGEDDPSSKPTSHSASLQAPYLGMVFLLACYILNSSL